MTTPDAGGMREFWEARAKENAAWYVDTSLSYDAPDMERFWATGKVVVDEALVNAPAQPAGRELAVEIGSGLGRICLALADHFDKVIGLDISQSMVDQARQLVHDPRIEFHVSDGVTLHPVEPGTADLVTTFTVLQHQSSKQLVLGYLVEAARALKPGGVLAAQWNNTPSMRFRLDRVRFVVRRLLRRTTGNTTAAEFLGTAVSRADVTRELAAAGMEIVAFRGEDTLFCWVWARRLAS